MTYYENFGWFTPAQLTRLALEVSGADKGLALVISQLAVIRETQLDVTLEAELMELVQGFLRKKISGLDDYARQFYAKYD